MNTLSPWANAVKDLFHGQDLPVLFSRGLAGYKLTLHNLANSLWIAVTCPLGTQVILRAAYVPNGWLEVRRLVKHDDRIDLSLGSALGEYRVVLEFPDPQKPLIRYTTTLKPPAPLLLPFWPRDMVITGPDDSDRQAKGRVLVSQVGTRSGLQYIALDEPASGALLYFQNLTALNDYAQATETSLGNTWAAAGLNWDLPCRQR